MSDINIRRQLKSLNNYLNNSKDFLSTPNQGYNADPFYDQHYYYYYYENMNLAPVTIQNPKTSNNTNNITSNKSDSFLSSDDNNNNFKSTSKQQKNYKLLFNKKFKNENIIYKNLLKLNIRRENIEKSLAATAYKSQLDAINWLLDHANDDLLITNQQSSRDFILMLCPINRLHNEITTFLKQSKIKYGTNDAHYNNMLPFMKLTSFFKINDSDVANLHRIFDYTFKFKYINDFNMSSSSLISSSSLSSLSSIDSVSSLSSTSSSSIQNDHVNPLINEINIDLHSSSQMVLLYPDIASENTIKNIVSEFTELVSLLQQRSFYKNYLQYQQIVPYTKQLHMTLAYQFNVEHQRALEDLANKCINYKEPAEWEVRLYSRDLRADGTHIYKVIQSFKSKSDSSIGCKKGDHIYVDSNRYNKDTSTMNGTSHTTGNNVTFSSKNVERAPESDTWVLHRNHALIQKNPTETKQQIQNETNRKRLSSNKQQTSGELKFVILRHGERVDLVFGPQWLDTSFDHYGNYRRTNLNMPQQLPQRPSKRDYNGDSPITEIGKIQARFTGDALKTESYNFQYCYVSPSLRSIQTAHHVLESMGLEKVCKLRVEPSLFEFLGWYEKGAPAFLNFDALIAFGYNMDTNYKPLINVDTLQADENYTDYYLRSFNLIKYLTNLHQREGGNVLIVGHAATLEVCTRQIIGQQIRSYADFNAIIRKVPYLGCCVLQKTNETGFDIIPSNVPPLTHGATFNFDSMSLKM